MAKKKDAAITSDEYATLSDQKLRDWTAHLRGRVPHRKFDADTLSRWILEDFCVRQFGGIRHSGHTLAWLADCISQILEGSNAESTFQIIGEGRGRKAGKTRTYDPVALAASFYLLQREGFKAEAAIEALRVRTGATRSTINRAAKGHRGFANEARFNIRTLRQLTGRDLAKIAPHIKRAHEFKLILVQLLV